MTDVRHQEVLRALDMVRPYVNGDGGDIELVGISDDGMVSIRLVGNCVGCGAAQNTIHDVIEDFLRSQLQWVTGVRGVEAGDEMPHNASISSMGATADLEALQRAIEARLECLERDMAALSSGTPLSSSVESSIRECRTELRLLHDMEEQCLFPAIEMFLNTLAGQIPALRERRLRLDIAFDAFERAAHDVVDGSSQTALDRFKVSLAEVAELVEQSFLCKQEALYEMVNVSLPDELKQELRGDLMQFRRRNIPMYQRS